MRKKEEKEGRDIPVLIRKGLEVALFGRVASLVEAKRAETHGSKSFDSHCNAVGSELDIKRRFQIGHCRYSSERLE